MRAYNLFLTLTLYNLSYLCCHIQKSNAVILEDSTTDIAQLIGMTDPWYKQSVLSLLSLSSDVLCQVPQLQLHLGSFSNRPSCAL